MTILKTRTKNWLPALVVGAVLLRAWGVTTAQTINADMVEAVESTFNVERFDVTQMEIPAQLVDGYTSSFTFEGTEYVMEMTAHSVRSDRFEILAPDEKGDLVPQPIPAPQTYRGRIQGLNGSIVSGSLVDGQFEGLILVNDDIIWEIEPLSKAVPNAAIDEYIVFDSTDLVPHGYQCGVEGDGHDHRLGLPDGIDGFQVGGGGGYEDALKFAEIAFDADFEFFQRNGSSIPNTVADIEAVMDRVDTIYQRDVEIGYEITTIIVRSQEPDPYTTTDPGALLGQFQNEWNRNQSGIQRDVAHLMTGKNINGGVIGIAFLRVICVLNSAYGLSQSRFTTSMTSRACLTAHELGHNWGANHCDGNGDCRIMCSGIGGCNRDCTRFGARSVTDITNFKNSRGCLSDAPMFKLDLVPPPPIQGGERTDWVVKNGIPNNQAALFYSLKGQGSTEVAPGIFIELRNPKLVSPIRTLDANGEAVWPILVPNVGLRLFTQVVDEDGNLTNNRIDDIQKN